MSQSDSTPDLPDYLPEWIKDHLRRYLASNGEEGHMWDASLGGGTGMVQTLLLTTKGRRSGKSLLLPLIYGEADGAYVLVASKGGAPTHPAWYLNLSANPDVDVQVKADRFHARARTATGDERTRLWDMMVGLYAPYTDYQARTEREIPVVVLEQIDG
jgi:deazaflavin-dependent oxidoreductase (nitroreductase family)